MINRLEVEVKNYLKSDTIIRIQKDTLYIKYKCEQILSRLENKTYNTTEDVLTTLELSISETVEQLISDLIDITE